MCSSLEMCGLARYPSLRGGRVRAKYIVMQEQEMDGGRRQTRLELCQVLVQPHSPHASSPHRQRDAVTIIVNESTASELGLP